MLTVDRDDPVHFAILGIANTFHLSACGQLDAELDIGDLYSLALLTDTVKNYEWEMHSPLTIKRNKEGVNGMLYFNPQCTLQLRYGELRLGGALFSLPNHPAD